MQKDLALKILTVLRDYFEPTARYEAAEGVVRECIDYRIDRGTLNGKKGKLYLSTAAAAAIPAWKDGRGAETQTVLDIGHPVANKHADTIVIAGHTDCGATNALYQALLTDAHPDSSMETRWMLPLAPKGLKAAVKDAGRHGADEQDILRKMAEAVVLQSMHNLQEYSFNRVTAKGLMNEGRLYTAGGMRDINRDPVTGKQKLYIFDANPDHMCFRDIREIYKEVGSPPIEQLAAEAPNRIVLPPQMLMMRQGAKSKTIAEINAAALRQAIKKTVASIHELGNGHVFR